MRSTSFLSKYLKFLFVMMLLITIGIVSVFADFRGTKSQAYASLLLLNEKQAEIHQEISNSEENYQIVPDINVFLSKNLSRKYVNESSKDIDVAHLLINNDSEVQIALGEISFIIKSNEVRASNFRLSIAESEDLKGSEILDGKIIFNSLDYFIEPGESLDIIIKADIGESFSGSKLQLSLVPKDNVSIYEHSERLNLSNKELITPAVTIVGR